MCGERLGGEVDAPRTGATDSVGKRPSRPPAASMPVVEFCRARNPLRRRHPRRRCRDRRFRQGRSPPGRHPRHGGPPGADREGPPREGDLRADRGAPGLVQGMANGRGRPGLCRGRGQGRRRLRGPHQCLLRSDQRGDLRHRPGLQLFPVDRQRGRGAPPDPPAQHGHPGGGPPGPLRFLRRSPESVAGRWSQPGRYFRGPHHPKSRVGPDGPSHGGQPADHPGKTAPRSEAADEGRLPARAQPPVDRVRANGARSGHAAGNRFDVADGRGRPREADPPERGRARNPGGGDGPVGGPPGLPSTAEFRHGNHPRQAVAPRHQPRHLLVVDGRGPRRESQRHP
mmetsp:Transcript_25731/g.60332  ORF Transcript_25731/g.60332 Transcript_25731/m.60332 type:complete len:341 (+) Transcript_25731:294-1316(+)